MMLRQTFILIAAPKI